MANPTPSPEPRRNRTDRERLTAPPATGNNGHEEGSEPEAGLASLGIWRSETAPRPANRRVTLESDRLRAAPRAEPEAKPAANLAELEQLRAENEELRSIAAELRGLLDEAAGKAGGADDEGLAEREREYERLLEEKSEVIRNLHLKIQELESRPEAAPVPVPAAAPTERDLLELSDELDRERAQMEQERRQLQEERRQLKEDEEAMVHQMREMEMQMSRERAELARQRNELQRLHNEIRHELEAAQRDSLVNERLRLLQRRHQEASARRGEVPDQPEEAPKPPPQAPQPAPKKDSGILRSIFGRRS